MKVYISLPISGYTIDHEEARCVFATGVLNAKGHEAVNPLDVCGAIGDEMDYAACMGRHIEALLRCDAILLVEGWKDSKGCNFRAQSCRNLRLAGV